MYSLRITMTFSEHPWAQLRASTGGDTDLGVGHHIRPAFASPFCSPILKGSVEGDAVPVRCAPLSSLHIASCITQSSCPMHDSSQILVPTLPNNELTWSRS